MFDGLPDLEIEIVVIGVGETAHRAWWRDEEFDPLTHSVKELVDWTEINGRGQRRYRHYMAALFDYIFAGQLVEMADLAVYMAENICGLEMAQDYLAIMIDAQNAGAFIQAEMFKAFVLGTLVSQDDCMAAALMAA